MVWGSEYAKDVWSEPGVALAFRLCACALYEPFGTVCSCLLLLRGHAFVNVLYLVCLFACSVCVMR